MVAVYGGSFDPPHVGHFLVASWVASACDVDALVMVPTAHHSLGKEAAADHAHRVAMCRLLTARIPSASVSPIEAELPLPSRTLNLLEALRAELGDARLRLVVGADIAAEKDRWYRWDRIEAIAPPLWVGRAGFPRPAGAVLDFPDVSSTGLRSMLGRGEDTTGLMLDEVRAYVAEHRLYRRAPA